MSDHVFGVPVLVSDKSKAARLTSVERRGGEFSEGWLQELLFEHPELLPVHGFEEVFDGAHAVGREVPTGAGPIDILYVNDRGWLILVETKLWRNPQARREVVAQIVDYAQAMSKWSCEDLENALHKSEVSTVKGRLVDVFKDDHDGFDESRFLDTLSRNLRLGRFLLLVVGDGIHEGVEQMAEFLQKTPQLQFTLGLVEMGLYRLDPNQKWPLYVQPRVVARTKEIERAVVTVTVTDGKASVEVSTPAPDDRKQKSRRKLTQEEFLEQVKENTTPSVAEYAGWLLDNAEEHGLTVVWQDTAAVLRYVDAAHDVEFTLGYLTRDGRFSGSNWLGFWLHKAGLPDKIAVAHKEELARILPGAEVRQLPGKKAKEKGATDVFFGGHDGLPLEKLLVEENKSKLFDVCERTIGFLQRELEKKE